MSVKLNLQHFNSNFNKELQGIKKLIIFNNPNDPIEVIVDGVNFIINNSKTFECHGLCFDISFECKNVTDVIIEYWK